LTPLEGPRRDHVKDLLKDIKGFADTAKGATDDYGDALQVGLDARSSAKDFLQGVKDGDEATVQAALTGWEDVNRTLEAIGKMDKAIEDAESGQALLEVLKTIGKVVKVGMTLAALA
jgi:hypothetical protein